MKIILWLVETITPRFDPVRDLPHSRRLALRELLAKAEREEREHGQSDNLVRR